MFNSGNVKFHVGCGFDVEPCENIPERLVVLQVDITQRKTHQGPAVDCNFKFRITESERDPELLVENERERVRLNLVLTPTTTVEEEIFSKYDQRQQIVFLLIITMHCVNDNILLIKARIEMDQLTGAVVLIEHDNKFTRSVSVDCSGY